MRKLTQHFTFTCGHHIYKIHAFPGFNYMVLETRDYVELEAAFFLYDIRQNKIEKKALSFDGSWWVTLGMAVNEVLIFQEYESDRNPVLQRCFAVNSEGDEIWSYECNKVEYKINVAILHNQEQTNIIYLESGRPAGTGAGSKAEADRRVDFPQVYRAGTAYFNEVGHFLSKKVNVQPVQVIEYKEKHELIFISFYIEEDDGMVNDLLVFNSAGDKIFKEKLDKKLTGISDNTFFFHNDKLIFVKDKVHFFVFDIST